MIGSITLKNDFFICNINFILTLINIAELKLYVAAQPKYNLYINLCQYDK